MFDSGSKENIATAAHKRASKKKRVAMKDLARNSRPLIPAESIGTPSHDEPTIHNSEISGFSS